MEELISLKAKWSALNRAREEMFLEMSKIQKRINDLEKHTFEIYENVNGNNVLRSTGVIANAKKAILEYKKLLRPNLASEEWIKQGNCYFDPEQNFGETYRFVVQFRREDGSVIT